MKFASLILTLSVVATVRGSVIPVYGGTGDGYDAAPATSSDPYAVDSGFGTEASAGFGNSESQGDSSGNSFGMSDSYGGDAYKTKCYPVYEIKYEDKCQQYTDRVCTTQHKESCHDGVAGENCNAIVTSKQVRKCFNTTELLCSLKEDIQYEVIQATFTVQKCQKVTERVCDTVYDMSFTAKDDYKCLLLNSVHCYPEETSLSDKTCKTTTSFECHEVHEQTTDPYGSSSGGDSYGSSYKAPSVPKTVCKKHKNTKCYTTPRTVTNEKCEVRKEKKCEKLPERVPYPVEKQHCHNEEKKVCELEQRQQPKQVKKYVYSKQCRPISRNICENADVKDLVQSCAPHATKSCRYTPVEKCVDVPKEHCYKVAKLVQKQKCEQVKNISHSYETETKY